MLKIRPLKKKDAQAVSKLIPQLTKNIVEAEILPLRIKKLVNQKNCRYLVAEIDNQIVGLAGLAWYAIPSKGLIGWIEEVVVDEQCRGQGVGSGLLEAILNMAENKGLAQVKLTTGNDVAQKLYEKLGFVKQNQNYLIKKYYQL